LSNFIPTIQSFHFFGLHIPLKELQLIIITLPKSVRDAAKLPLIKSERGESRFIAQTLVYQACK
jgi:hypothetical protein